MRYFMSEPTVHRRLAAIMFSDICGFSLIMGRDEAQGMRVLARYEACMNTAVEEFGGRIIKRLGDGMLVEFLSAVSAVECAMSIQRRIAEQNMAVAESDQFQVRIGVHLGDVVVSNGDILGDGVNVASRIEPLAPPGGICISQDVYNQVQNKIEMEVVALGPQQLKNIHRQVEIYRVIVAAANGAAEGTMEAPVKKPASKSKWIWVAIGAVVLCLAAAGVVAAKRGWEQKQAVETLQKADEFLTMNQPSKARILLEKAVKQLPPTTPKWNDLQARLTTAKDMELKERLQRRFDAMAVTILAKNWEAAAQFADPDSKMRLGIKNISGRLAVAGFFADLLRVKKEHFRIREMKLSEDRKSATIIPELHLFNEWKPQNPMYWKFTNDEWYFVVE